jgi:hypothetical protein
MNEETNATEKDGCEESSTRSGPAPCLAAWSREDNSLAVGPRQPRAFLAIALATLGGQPSGNKARAQQEGSRSQKWWSTSSAFGPSQMIRRSDLLCPIGIHVGKLPLNGQQERCDFTLIAAVR